MQRKKAIGLALFCVYAGSIALANWLTTRYGLITVFPGLQATAGTLAIGGAIMTRDLIQDTLGRAAIIAGIAVGAGLSYLISAPQIARASAITFLIAELIEFIVYTPLRRRVSWGSGRWGGIVGVANFTGALADTLLFLWLAGFPLTLSIVTGQMVGKAYVTAAVVGGGLLVNALFRHPEQRAGAAGNV